MKYSLRKFRFPLYAIFILMILSAGIFWGIRKATEGYEFVTIPVHTGWRGSNQPLRSGEVVDILGSQYFQRGLTSCPSPSLFEVMKGVKIYYVEPLLTQPEGQSRDPLDGTLQNATFWLPKKQAHLLLKKLEELQSERPQVRSKNHPNAPIAFIVIRKLPVLQSTNSTS